jgi:hypothetical protein
LKRGKEQQPPKYSNVLIVVPLWGVCPYLGLGSSFNWRVVLLNLVNESFIHQKKKEKKKNDHQNMGMQPQQPWHIRHGEKSST